MENNEKILIKEDDIFVTKGHQKSRNSNTDDDDIKFKKFIESFYKYSDTLYTNEGCLHCKSKNTEFINKYKSCYIDPIIVIADGDDIVIYDSTYEFLKKYKILFNSYIIDVSINAIDISHDISTEVQLGVIKKIFDDNSFTLKQKVDFIKSLQNHSFFRGIYKDSLVFSNKLNSYINSIKEEYELSKKIKEIQRNMKQNNKRIGNTNMFLEAVNDSDIELLIDNTYNGYNVYGDDIESTYLFINKNDAIEIIDTLTNAIRMMEK